MNNHRLFRFKKQITQMIFLFSVFCFLVSSIGCEAFVRKFTRKRKKTVVKQEVILVPEDYSPLDIPVEERYRQYFLFWKSWQDELIVSLGGSLFSHKRWKSCLEEAIKNLVNLRPFLFEEKQKDLDVYLKKLGQLKDEIDQDTYASNLLRHKRKAESLKRSILRDFSYPKVKGHLR